MLGAFSFGKVIKTLLPGGVLCLGLLLALDDLSALLGLASPIGMAFSDVERAKLTLAVLLPVTLFLGFVLNTFVWRFINPRIAPKVRNDIDADKDGFGALRKKLADERDRVLAATAGLSRFSALTDEKRDSFEYFYLPILTIERLNHVWESYFSWYEFQINSCGALAVTLLGACFLPLRVLPGWPERISGGVAIVGIGVPAIMFLFRCARHNLLQYHRNLLILIAACLERESKTLAATAAAGASEPH